MMSSQAEENLSVTLFAIGDLLLCGRYSDFASKGNEDKVFSQIKSFLEQADITVGNMECPLTVRGLPREDKLCLRGSPKYARVLGDSGFNVLSLANNHIFDFGIDGFLDTRASLREAGINVLGAGEDHSEAIAPVIMAVGGLRFGFLAYAHESTKGSCWAAPGIAGMARLTKERLLEAIKILLPTVDHVVVLCHWGLEYSPFPTPEQVELAHCAIDAGARLIIGHHSHMLQGIEEYKGGVIAYSLGNLTDSNVDWQGPTRHFASQMCEADRETIILKCEFKNGGVRLLEPVPVWLGDEGVPIPATGERAAIIMRKLQERSENLDPAKLKAYWEELVISRRVGGAFREWWRRGSLFDKLRGFRFAQVKVLFDLIMIVVRTKFSKDEDRWEIFTSRNDTKPMPYCGEDEDSA